MIAIRLLRERQCDTCSRQTEWGCTAKRWRFPEEGEPDSPENWVDPAAMPQTVMGEDNYACPRQHLKENPRFWAWLLKYYGFYKRGHLPDVGAVSSQSNRAMELFRVLDEANILVDEEEERRSRQKSQRGPPRNGQQR